MPNTLAHIGVQPLLPAEAGHLLRTWLTAQASLAFCLLLAGAFALLARRPGPVFAALAWGSLLHLLLDALQVKWGGGVLLLAPVSWRSLSFDLFWPESGPTAVLTLAGREIAFDRESWDGAAGRFRVYTGESLRLVGEGLPGHAARLSVQGVFRDPETLEVARFHTHPRGWRDGASYLGLLVVAWSWLPVGGSGRGAA